MKYEKQKKKIKPQTLNNLKIENINKIKIIG